MKIEWLHDVELSVVESFDEATDTPENSTETFRKGEQVGVDVFEERQDSIDIQFGNGAVAYNVLREWFKTN